MRTPAPFPLPTVPTPGRDLVALGISDRVLQVAVCRGRLLRLRRDVYLDPAAWPVEADARHLVRAHAEFVAHPDGAVSHWSAARFWGLPIPTSCLPGDSVWLTQPRGTAYRSRSLPGVEHRIGALPGHHTTLARAGYVVTSRARTAVDLCRDLPLTESLQILDACVRQECLELVTQARRRDLANPRLVNAGSLALREAARTLPRMSRVRAALEIANPLRESPIESLSFAHFVGSGLPLPACQVGIVTPAGVLFPDFFWEGANLIGEADGRVKYEDSAAIVREKEREQLLRDLGFRIVRWLGKEIHLQPEVVVARVSRALAL